MEETPEKVQCASGPNSYDAHEFDVVRSRLRSPIPAARKILAIDQQKHKCSRLRLYILPELLNPVTFRKLYTSFVYDLHGGVNFVAASVESNEHKWPFSDLSSAAPRDGRWHRAVTG
jgi:hypothetical protein